MKTKVLLKIIVYAFLSTLLCTSAYAADETEPQVAEALVPDGDILNMNMDAYYALNGLTPNQDVISKDAESQRLTDIFDAALLSSQSEITFTTTKSNDDVFDIYFTAIYNNPWLYYVETSANLSYIGDAKTIYPNYISKGDTTTFNNRIQEFLSIYNQPAYTDFEKVKAAHDYIVLNCAYDTHGYYDPAIEMSPYSNNAYGVFVNRVAACTGYATALKLLLNEMSIECYFITSDSMGHAWNIVKLSNDYYHVDATWSDPVFNLTYDIYDYPMDMPGYLRYDYLLISDAVISDANHNHSGWSSSAPLCESNDYMWLQGMEYPVQIDNYIYYLTSWSSDINRIDITGSNQSTYIDSNDSKYLLEYSGNLYYYDSSASAILKYSINTGTAQTVVECSLVDMYLSNHTIYYYNTSASTWNSFDLDTLSDYDYDANTGVISQYLGTDSTIVIPSIINGTTITAIGSDAFSNTSVASITIPTTVTSIGTNAFYNCSQLTEVHIPDSVLSISNDAFTQTNASIILYGSIGSYAHTFAISNGIPFLPDRDLNHDGVVDMLDLVLVALGYNSTNAQLDLNADGIVNIFDLITISMLIQ